MLSNYSSTFDKGVFFTILPVTFAGEPADLKGAVPTLVNNNPELFTAEIVPDGRLKITPKNIAGTGTVQLSASVAGVFTGGGLLTITFTAPLPSAQTFDYVVESTFSV